MPGITPAEAAALETAATLARSMSSKSFTPVTMAPASPVLLKVSTLR